MTATLSSFSHQFHNHCARDETARHIPGLHVFREYTLNTCLVCDCRRLSQRYEYSCVPLARSGAEGIRTPDLLRAREALSQLSFGPAFDSLALPVSVGLSGLEPETFPLSEGCSNQLS